MQEIFNSFREEIVHYYVQNGVSLGIVVAKGPGQLVLGHLISPVGPGMMISPPSSTSMMNGTAASRALLASLDQPASTGRCRQPWSTRNLLIRLKSTHQIRMLFFILTLRVIRCNARIWAGVVHGWPDFLFAVSSPAFASTSFTILLIFHKISQH